MKLEELLKLYDGEVRLFEMVNVKGDRYKIEKQLFYIGYLRPEEFNEYKDREVDSFEIEEYDDYYGTYSYLNIKLECE